MRKFSYFCHNWDSYLEKGRKYWNEKQKQPSGRVLNKRFSENMQQIYRKTPMPKCDFNKVDLQFYWNHTSAWVFSSKFAAYFQNTFSEEQVWTAASEEVSDNLGVCVLNRQIAFNRNQNHELDQVIKRTRRKFLILCNNPARFGRHRCYSNGDKSPVTTCSEGCMT